MTLGIQAGKARVPEPGREVGFGQPLLHVSADGEKRQRMEAIEK